MSRWQAGSLYAAEGAGGLRVRGLALGADRTVTLPEEPAGAVLVSWLGLVLTPSEYEREGRVVRLAGGDAGDPVVVAYL